MTTIVDKVQSLNAKFGEIEVGEFFKYHNDIYLKTSYSSSVESNAFDLSRGEQSIFEYPDTVQAINATITVEPKYKAIDNT